MQCLYACRALATAYLSPATAKQAASTSLGKRLQGFFAEYSAEGVSDEVSFDPLPYVEDALKEGDFTYLEDHNPMEGLERLFHALSVSQGKGLLASQSFFGRFVTSVIYTSSTCDKCGHVCWDSHEDPFLRLTPPQRLELVLEPMEEKRYTEEKIEDETCYVPRNAKTKSETDVATALINCFRRRVKASKLCDVCGSTQQFTQLRFVRTAPEIMVIRLECKGGPRFKINPLLFIDDIWIIDSNSAEFPLSVDKKVTNKLIYDKVRNANTEEAQMKICGYELAAIITGKYEEAQQGEDTYTAYIRCGAQWYLTGDSFVDKVDEAVALQADARILFYRKTIDLLY